MKRLAVYAHYDRSPQVAGHVLYCLRHILELGFQICFVSNSALSAASEAALKKICERVLVRENSGLDFGMWQHGLAHYDLLQFDELLLTNSSIIGPLQPVEPVWRSPELADCDFWALTDNQELGAHLQSYFLVFRQRVLHSPRFQEFWRAVLPYQEKLQVIYSYELGLSRWLTEGGFVGRAVYQQAGIVAAYQNGCGPLKRCGVKFRRLQYFIRNRTLPSHNTTLVYPDLLMERGMPFLKASLLSENSFRMTPETAFALLEKFALPVELIAELRQQYAVPAPSSVGKS